MFGLHCFICCQVGTGPKVNGAVGFEVARLLPSALETWTCARAPTRTVTRSDSRGRAATASARLPPTVAADRTWVPAPVTGIWLRIHL